MANNNESMKINNIIINENECIKWKCGSSINMCKVAMVMYNNEINISIIISVMCIIYNNMYEI